MKMIRVSIGFLLMVVAYACYFVLATPRTDLFLIAINSVRIADPVEKAIAKAYIKMTENKICSSDGNYVPKKFRKDDGRLLHAMSLAFLSSTNKDYHGMMDKKILLKEIDEASKYCGNTDGKIPEFPASVSVIVSKDIDYFDAVARNCISFDVKYDGPNSIRTPRELLQNLMSCSEGEDNVIYTEMMNSLRRNEARCSGK